MFHFMNQGLLYFGGAGAQSKNDEIKAEDGVEKNRNKDSGQAKKPTEKGNKRKYKLINNK